MLDLAAFFEMASKIAVSDEEAVDAAKMLSENPRSRARKYVDAGVVGGALNPAVDAAGHFAKGLADAAPGARVAGGKATVGKELTRGGLARSATRGLLGGMVIQAGREGMQLRRAKDTYHRFMEEQGA